MDYFSRYVEIAKLYSQTSASIINHLKSIMARHVICEYFHSDGGSYFTSSTFKEFAKQYDFEIITSSPKLAQSNGMIERHLGTIKDMLKKDEDPYIALLAYRTTPLHNGFTPAELLMGRKLRTTLPVQPKLLNPKWPDMRKVASREKNIKQNQKLHYDKRHRARVLKPLSKRQHVRVKDQRKTGIVQYEIEFPRSYHVQTDQATGDFYRRCLKKMNQIQMAKAKDALRQTPIHQINCAIIQRKH